MGRTIRRTPFSVKVDNDDFNIGYYNQTDFKGINTNKNDATADPSAFADAQNVYVDENALLISRPPVKIYDGEGWILNEWMFGSYGIRFHRMLIDQDGNRVDDPQNHSIDDLRYAFVLRCITHNTVTGTYNGYQIYGSLQWTIPVSSIGWNAIPRIMPVQIEDKVFFWFAGVSLIDFNTKGVLMSDGSYYPYFEDSLKYLYYPVCKLVINGIESDLETKNFLTDTYRRRYQYSPLSTVNFDALIGRYMDVSLNGDMTQNTTKYLYNTKMQEEQDMVLIYPYAEMGNGYYVDIVQAARATVFMRYGLATHIIEVSFDGRAYQGLPILDDIIGEPLLTKDGLWCVAFTRRGVAQCRLVAQETEDFVEPERIFSWTINPYARNNLMNGFAAYFEDIDATYKPRGYFETIDNFTYIFWGKNIYNDIKDEYIPYCYTEWLSGTNDAVWSFNSFIGIWPEGSNEPASLLVDDNFRIHFRYVTPTSDHQDLGGVVTLFADKMRGLTEDNEVIIQNKVVYMVINRLVIENVGRKIMNDDTIWISEDFGSIISNPNGRGRVFYIHRLNAAGTQAVNDEQSVYSNDLVLLTPFPLYASSDNDYAGDVAYQRFDTVTYSSKIYRAIVDTVGHAPSGTTDDNTYWQYLAESTFAFGYSVNGVSYTARLPWSTGWMLMSGVRYRAVLTDGGTGAMYPGDRIKFSSVDFDIIYTADDLQNFFGNFPKDVNDPNNTSWSSFGSRIVSKAQNASIFTGNTYIYGLDNTAETARSLRLGLIETIGSDDDTYTVTGLTAPVQQMDIQAMSPVITSAEMTYDILIAYGVNGQNAAGESLMFDVFQRITYEYNAEKFSAKGSIYAGFGSRWYRILQDTNTVLTDNYYWLADIEGEGSGTIVITPKNGELSTVITDDARNIISDDNVTIAYNEGDNEEGDPVVVSANGKVYKLDESGVALATGDISSGSLVSWVTNAATDYDYLNQNVQRFYIEKLGTDGEGNWTVAAGGMSYGDLIRFRGTDQTITLPANSIGNPTDTAVTVQPKNYPAAPSGWQLGDDWPTTDAWKNLPKPLFVEPDNTIRPWAAGDLLPTGPLTYYGAVNILREFVPLSIGDDGVWYDVSGTLWTSQVSTGNTVELDEYINATVEQIYDEEGNFLYNLRTVTANWACPTHAGMLDAYFLSFYHDGKNLLEISSARRDERKLYSEEGDDLFLYFPKANEQNMSNTITNLHNLSETAMGVWTEDSMYYISPVTDESLGLVYTKPLKSKIPVGCREGNEIITALDGQAIILSTARGIAAMAPEDFVATTERTFSYLSDAIQDIYYKFYNETVQSAALVPEEFEIGYRPMIKIDTYKYWIIFWRYMDKTVLALDTRNASWWKWVLPYPIRDVMVTSRLHFVEQIDYNPVTPSGIEVPPEKAPLMGIDYIWTDREVDIKLDEDTEFPTLTYTPVANIGYYDDVIDGALNGESILIYENEFVDDRRELLYAEPTISWYLISQKIAFGALNNYKVIKQITMSAKGIDAITTKMSTKAFRDLTHPEQSVVTEIKINDLRTFVYRTNLMHVTNFQYRLENDTNEDTRVQLKLNTLGIKYEVKENIR